MVIRILINIDIDIIQMNLKMTMTRLIFYEEKPQYDRIEVNNYVTTY